MDPLVPEFFAHNTVDVARNLLGKTLMAWQPESQDYLPCRIVETEAYTQNDPACHAFRGNKGRAATLFKQPGLAYVYFIYGMYYCLNVVTEPENTAGAVLFRAVEPLGDASLKTNGPGRLCKALGITKALHNEIVLTEENRLLYLGEGEEVPDKSVITTTRIGISTAQEYPWRFYINNNPWVSVKAKTLSQ